VLLEVTENNDVVDQGGGLAMKFADAFSERADIALALDTKSFASLGDPMTVMKKLDRLLEADCNAQSDDNCGNVNEETFPGMQSLLGWVDIEHGFRVLLTCS
jgi:hypothetical protein